MLHDDPSLLKDVVSILFSDPTSTTLNAINIAKYLRGIQAQLEFKFIPEPDVVQIDTVTGDIRGLYQVSDDVPVDSSLGTEESPSVGGSIPKQLPQSGVADKPTKRVVANIQAL